MMMRPCSRRISRILPTSPALHSRHARLNSGVCEAHRNLNERSIRLRHSPLRLDTRVKLRTIRAIDGKGDSQFDGAFSVAYGALLQEMGWHDAVVSFAASEQRTAAHLPLIPSRAMVCLWHGYAPTITPLAVHGSIATIGCSVNSFIYNGAPAARFISLTGIELGASSSIVPFSTRGAALPALDTWRNLFNRSKAAHWLLLNDNTCMNDDCTSLQSRLQALFPDSLVAGAKATDSSSAASLNALMQHEDKFVGSTCHDPSGATVGLVLVCDSQCQVEVNDMMSIIASMYGDAEFDSWKPLYVSALLQRHLFGVEPHKLPRHHEDSARMQLLPMFIADAVVVPGQRAEYRIFEPRYKLMIRRAVHNNVPFCITLPPTTVRSGYLPSAVPLASEEPVESAIEGISSTVSVNSSIGLAHAATVVRLDSVELTPENGVRISVTGISRMACHDFVVAPATFGLIHGAGHQVRDLMDSSRCDHVIADLKNIWQGDTAGHLIFRKIWASWHPAHPVPPFEQLSIESLSWWLAEKLQVSEHKRQTYLSCTTTHERLQMQLVHLQDKVASLQMHVNSAVGR